MTGMVILGGVLAFIVLWVIALYNGLIKKKNLMQEAWSGIDVQLKRRHDLVPNLVKAVEGYMGHERGLLENIAKFRSQSVSATGLKEKGEAESALTQGLRQLFAVAEAYPDLKANQNFLDLQLKLSDLENELQMARRYYNATARDYNISIDSFPTVMVARQLNFTRAEFFQAEEGDKAVPQVNFTHTS